MIASNNRGDTIIEVMFSFVVFSMVVIGAFTLMNQGVAMGQRSLELTLVRQQIDAQVTLAKYIQANDSVAWTNLITPAPAGKLSTPPTFSDVSTCPTSSGLTRAFFFGRSADSLKIITKDVNLSSFSLATNFSTVDYMNTTPHAYGLWAYMSKAETVAGSTQPGNNAYDLHVRACWSSVGTRQPMTIGTVTRLYDVR